MRAFLVVVFVFGSAGAAAKPVTQRPVEVPTVAGSGYDSLDVNRLSLVATRGSIIIDGQPITRTSAHELVIPQLKQVLDQRLEAGTKPELTMFLDKATPYRSLIEIVFTAREAGIKEFYLATQTTRGAVAARLTMPRNDELADAATPGMMVSVLEHEILIWSRSGLEGSLAKPKHAIRIGPDALHQLTSALSSIAQRWWPADRHDPSRVIALQADANVPAQTIAHVIGAVRATADGRPLFPSVALSSV
ncbi:MAG: biopolymer transporter ExbD [Deltaproteobacteria bacterium]|nr:biopolymer transporter ExbD [Deltaproteobacteria bacterium]